MVSCKQDCHNGILDPGEEGVDCGGKCWSCYIPDDQPVCEYYPEMYGQLYSLYPDTSGFSNQPPPDTSEAIPYFMFLSTTTHHIIETCAGNISNGLYNSLDHDLYQKVARYSLEENLSGQYEVTFMEFTHWRKDPASCHFFPVHCKWFSNKSGQKTYHFVDQGNFIYVIIKREVTINGSLYKEYVRDTLKYYPIN